VLPGLEQVPGLELELVLGPGPELALVPGLELELVLVLARALGQRKQQLIHPPVPLAELQKLSVLFSFFLL